MTNRNSHQHGHTMSNQTRPKSGRRGHGGAFERRERARVASQNRHSFRMALVEKA